MEILYFSKKQYSDISSFKTQLSNKFILTTGYDEKRITNICPEVAIHASGQYFGVTDKHTHVWAAAFLNNTGYLVKTEIKDKPTFDECFNLINTELDKKRAKWQLKAVAWMDYDDVKQVILNHLYHKWDLYDNSKFSIATWLNAVIRNQTSNLLRNNYYNYCKPCVSCPLWNGESCDKFDYSFSSCSLYKKWENSRKRAHDVKLPLPLEHHTKEVYENTQDAVIDVDEAINYLADCLPGKLNEIENSVFNWLYMDSYEEEDVILLIEKNYQKTISKKQLSNIKKKIVKHSATFLKDSDFNIY